MPAGYSDVDRVRDATDLVSLIGEHVALRPKGREHVGLCPFHDDHKPSFAVVTHKDHAFYKCHACGAGGDAFDFVKHYHRLDFVEALRFLADRAGIALRPPERASRNAAYGDHGGHGDHGDHGDEGGARRSDLRAANDLAAQFFQRVLHSESVGKVGRDIVESRGMSSDMAREFMIGLAPDRWDGLLSVIRKRNLPEGHFIAAGLLKRREGMNGENRTYDAFRNRLIFPICNEVGQPIAFGGRKINPEDEPKYLNSAESAIFQKSRTLYGLHLAKRAIIESKVAVVTEGYTDVIAAHQHGLRNVVGTLGTALTTEHAGMLARLCDTVVLLFDGDEAGLRAADRGVEVFFAQPVDVRICAIPGGLDPDDVLRQEGGAERLRELIASAEDALAYKVRRFRQTLQDAAGLSSRQKRLEEFLGDLSRLGFTAMQGVRKRFVLSQLSDLLAVPMHEIERLMPRPRQRPLLQQDDHNKVAEPAIAFLQDQPRSALLSPARRRAEHELLAVLIYDPSLGQCTIEADSRTGRVWELVECSNILEPSARSIAELILKWMQIGEPFTMQRLLGELRSPEAKSLASALYFEGERICHAAAPVTEAIAHAVTALLSHVELAEHNQLIAEFQQRCRTQQPDPTGADHLRDLIERRRKLSQNGTIATALAKGVRT